jgi:hypothetical protein
MYRQLANLHRLIVFPIFVHISSTSKFMFRNRSPYSVSNMVVRFCGNLGASGAVVRIQAIETWYRGDS